MRLAVLALGLALTLASSTAHALVPTTRNLVAHANRNDYAANGYSACWAYVHSDGREYAVIGTGNGTAIYNVTVPAATYQVGFIPGPTSLWREMKSYRDWIYIVTEGSGTNQGLQVVRMTNPESPVLVRNWTGSFIRSHTVSVDTARALLICNGTRNATGQATGMRFLSLADPENPVEVGWWPGGAVPVSESNYVHDSVPFGNVLYASSINAGIQRVLDITTLAAPVQTAAWSYDGAFTHNAWPDASAQYLYVTDEVGGEPLKIFDLSSLPVPTLVNTITSNPDAIVHNAHVHGNDLWLSNYTEGIRALDLTDPAHPAEWAWGDSYPGLSGGFFGVWEVCPYFPSGTVIASDMQSGLHVYRAVRDYGLVRVELSVAGGVPALAAGCHGGGEAGLRASSPHHGGCSAEGCSCGTDCACEHGATGLTLADFRVRLVEQGDSLVTPGDGIVMFAPSPGTHTVEVSRFGWVTRTATVTVGLADRDTVRLTMQALPRTDLAGVVRSAATLEPLLEAEVNLESPGPGLHDHTNAGGGWAIAQVPHGVYQTSVRAPGHAPLVQQRGVGTSLPASIEYALAPTALWHEFEVPDGWAQGFSGDNATTGQWVRVEPLGTGAVNPPDTRMREAGPAALVRGPAERHHEGHESDGAVPGDVQPETDRSPSGTLCWVTGQGSNPGSIGEADVDGGRTSLVSPYFDLAGMTTPTFGAWVWFYSSAPKVPGDYLRVFLNAEGSATWVLAREITGLENHWREVAIPVRDFLPAASRFRVRFTAADSASGTVVEAAVDDAVLYDAALAVTEAPPVSRLVIERVRPNPTRGETSLSLTLPRAGRLEADVLDLQGRVVRVLAREAAAAGERTLRWDGRDAGGRAAAPGLYLVRVNAAGETRTARVMRLE